MSNSSPHKDIQALIGKYLSREASPEEIKFLEQWVQESDEHKKTFRQTRDAMALASSKNKNTSIELQKEWKKFQSKISQENQSLALRKTLSIKSWVSIAAAVAVLITAAYFIINLVLDPGTEKLMALDTTIEEVLSDGSKITLNHHSALSFPKTFDDSIRKVKLEGDAFFSVHHDPGQPFVIETQNSTVRVLGTEFYVNSHEDKNFIEVVVSSGKVAFSVDGQETVFLTAGEKSIFNKSKQHLSEFENKDQNFISWKTKRMIFDDQSLIDVANVIERTYHQQITIDENLKNCRLTATFENQSLNAVLTILQETFSINITKQNNEYLISGASCN